jgi:hypothetical protein
VHAAFSSLLSLLQPCCWWLPRARACKGGFPGWLVSLAGRRPCPHTPGRGTASQDG